MTTGNIAKWLKKEGDSLAAGDAIAEVETDKTTVTFEALDDAFLAKILVKEGTDIPVGNPIMVLVDEQEFVSKFADFKAPTTNSAPAVPTAAPSIAAPATPPPSVKSPEPVKKVELPPVKSIEIPPVKSSPTLPAKASEAISKSSTSHGVASIAWGTGASKCGIASKLANDQNEYVKKYGTSSHIPLKL